ncbi:MAG: cobalamin B12-binding domain-containing protein [Eubacteriales bacterium]
MEKDFKLYFDTLFEYLQTFNKVKSLEYCMTLLGENTVTVPELYEMVLAPALNGIVIPRGDENSLIWQEHTATNIVRNIIECSYPFVIKEKTEYEKPGTRKKIILLCPEEEYHEIGIRMGADFFTIVNFEVIYIGCNTPKENIISAIKQINPDFIGVGVSNYLNLVSLNKIIQSIRANHINNIRYCNRRFSPGVYWIVNIRTSKGFIENDHREFVTDNRKSRQTR